MLLDLPFYSAVSKMLWDCWWWSPCFGKLPGPRWSFAFHSCLYICFFIEVSIYNMNKQECKSIFKLFLPWSPSKFSENLLLLISSIFFSKKFLSIPFWIEIVERLIFKQIKIFGSNPRLLKYAYKRNAARKNFNSMHVSKQ